MFTVRINLIRSTNLVEDFSNSVARVGFELTPNPDQSRVCSPLIQTLRFMHFDLSRFALLEFLFSLCFHASYVDLGSLFLHFHLLLLRATIKISKPYNICWKFRKQMLLNILCFVLCKYLKCWWGTAKNWSSFEFWKLFVFILIQMKRN